MYVWNGQYFDIFSFHDLMCCDVLRAASLQAVPAIADANKVQIAEHILPLWNTHVHYVPLCSITFHCSLLVPTCQFCFHHDSFRNDRFWLSQKLSKLSPFLLRIRWIRTSRRSNSEQLLRVAAQRRWEVSQVSGTCNSPATWCICFANFAGFEKIEKPWLFVSSRCFCPLLCESFDAFLPLREE